MVRWATSKWGGASKESKAMEIFVGLENYRIWNSNYQGLQELRAGISVEEG